MLGSVHLFLLYEVLDDGVLFFLKAQSVACYRHAISTGVPISLFWRRQNEKLAFAHN